MHKLLNFLVLNTVLIMASNTLTDDKIVFASRQNVDNIKSLANVLIDRNLGEIYVGTNSKPTAKQIKIALVKNRNFDLDISAVIVVQINTREAKIIVDDIKYTDKVRVFFKISNFKKIAEKKFYQSLVVIKKKFDI